MGLYPGGEYIRGTYIRNNRYAYQIDGVISVREYIWRGLQPGSGGLISGIITLLADRWDYIRDGNISGGLISGIIAMLIR